MSQPLTQSAALATNGKKEITGSAPESVALTAGGIAALLAGACCLGPLVLVSVGLGGAWLANLQLLEPYRLVFIGIALLALGFAWKRIYRPAAECKPGEACAVPRVRRVHKAGFWIVTALLLVMFGFPYFAPLFY
jgi:mercuric ion transport protein